MRWVISNEMKLVLSKELTDISCQLQKGIQICSYYTKMPGSLHLELNKLFY